ncbi:SDR family oxidoreductase [Salicibibacter cibarius]|uniref:SDR family oxidoreductase n=1 Tax=Salicibibacter cibarius TaxID=2743000 RepID=A0A7T6Z7S0_9BACI|nr:SDR family oxidoreductase [Salicibibacter cibarius]QQK78430.1 SDR family oxidoreductase [Salicibibacter cibarius]
MRLWEKVAIITGGGQGIGEQIAKTFGREGAKIVVAELNEETGSKVSSELRDSGIESIFVKTDVSNEQSIIDMVESAKKQFGGIDILVNNAAIAVRKSVVDTTLDDWQKVMNVNLTGPFLGSKYTIPEMINRNGGSIINIGSWHAEKTITRFASYPAAKGGLQALTRQMALDYGEHNIRVNAVCPSMVDTPLERGTFATLPDPEDAYNQALDFQPMGRIGTVEDIANACLFFASDESVYVSGQSLMVDGAAINKLARPLMFD